MNETRETAHADAYPTIPPLAGVSPPAARKKPDLCHKKIHVVNFFVTKINSVPCCRRRICRSPGETSGLHAHRVRPVIDRTYAVVDLAGICRDNRPDSPPAGRKSPFFFTKILHKVQNFGEKDKQRTMLPQANRAFIRSNARFEHAPRTSCH
jgi:hypothetical protein